MSEAEIMNVFGIELADTPTPVQSTGKSPQSLLMQKPDTYSCVHSRTENKAAEKGQPKNKFERPRRRSRQRHERDGRENRGGSRPRQAERPKNERRRQSQNRSGTRRPDGADMKHRPPENKDREDRFTDEVVVDAYGEEERAMGWYYYAADNIVFPFKAQCSAKRAASPLKVSGKSR